MSRTGLRTVVPEPANRTKSGIRRKPRAHPHLMPQPPAVQPFSEPSRVSSCKSAATPQPVQAIRSSGESST